MAGNNRDYSWSELRNEAGQFGCWPSGSASALCPARSPLSLALARRPARVRRELSFNKCPSRVRGLTGFGCKNKIPCVRRNPSLLFYPILILISQEGISHGFQD